MFQAMLYKFDAQVYLEDGIYKVTTDPTVIELLDNNGIPHVSTTMEIRSKHPDGSTRYEILEPGSYKKQLNGEDVYVGSASGNTLSADGNNPLFIRFTPFNGNLRQSSILDLGIIDDIVDICKYTSYRFGGTACISQ